MIKKNVELFINGKQDTAQLIIDSNTIKLIYLKQEWIGSDSIPFIALNKLRLQLENANILLLVNGSRIDVFPSGMQMSMQMTGAYINVMGETGGEVVDIFDDCSDLDFISTVRNQEQFHKDWIESIS